MTRASFIFSIALASSEFIGKGGLTIGGYMGGRGKLPVMSCKYFAREEASKYPETGTTAFLACQLMTACLLIGPKTPSGKMGKLEPEVFRYCWRHLTSSPRAPNPRSRVKLQLTTRV